jgi:spermidine/putrescine transport system substrate-binding protein
MSDRYTRAGFLRRAAAGGTVLTVPVCWPHAAAVVAAARPPRLRGRCRRRSPGRTGRSIDIDEKTKKHPSLAAFEKKYGVNVNSWRTSTTTTFFGKIQGRCRRGQSVGRDIVVLTDASGIPARMIELGWVEKLDRSALPNISNLCRFSSIPPGTRTGRTACRGSRA